MKFFLRDGFGDVSFLSFFFFSLLFFYGGGEGGGSRSYGKFASTQLQWLVVNPIPSEIRSFLLNMIREQSCAFVFACQDEVIGVSKKVVVRVEHLVKWTCPEPPQWKRNTKKIHVLNGSPCITDPEEVKTKGKLEGCNGAAFRPIRGSLSDTSACLWYEIWRTFFSELPPDC